jgi:hypothetical protein
VVTNPTKVISSHIRWPSKRAFGHLIYWLIVENGEFVSASQPIIYDQNGQPTTLHSEPAPGSLVRVEHDGNGVLKSVQLIDAKFENPFRNGGDTICGWSPKTADRAGAQAGRVRKHGLSLASTATCEWSWQAARRGPWKTPQWHSWPLRGGRASVLGTHRPASTLIIGGLSNPAWKVEVEGIAVA